MRWARAMVASVFGGSQPELGRAPEPGRLTVPRFSRAA
jgi:hypothetical protein